MLVLSKIEAQATIDDILTAYHDPLESDSSYFKRIEVNLPSVMFKETQSSYHNVTIGLVGPPEGVVGR